MYHYQAGHSHLRIVVRTDDETYSLAFDGVRYIDAPMQWVGTEFIVKSPEEGLQLSQAMGLLNVKAGDFTLFESRAQQIILKYPTWWRSILLNLYLKILSLSPFSTYKNHCVRILAHNMARESMDG